MLTAYDEITPDVDNPAQKVVFGTSGHRGSSLDGAFNEAHILAITQAICEYRAGEGHHWPLLVGRDSHGLSGAGLAHGARGAGRQRRTDPALTARTGSRRPLRCHTRSCGSTAAPAAGADGIVITPSHNPPRDGGFKYNPPHGGPADSDATGWIAARANELIAGGNRRGTAQVLSTRCRQHAGEYDFLDHYVDDLPSVLNLDAIRDAGVRIGADPFGGASVDYWAAIAEGLPARPDGGQPEGRPDLVVHDAGPRRQDPDGLLLAVRDGPRGRPARPVRRCHGNDADADRHGIVTPDAGLMNPNHYLAVAISYLFANRQWGPDVAIGKTLVSRR